MNPAGETGFITKDIISKYAPKADGAEKVKVSDVQGQSWLSTADTCVFALMS